MFLMTIKNNLIVGNAMKRIKKKKNTTKKKFTLNIAC